MDIEQYATTHNFIYISVAEIRKHCSTVLPFTLLGKTLMVKFPAQVYAEVLEVCEQEVFDYLLMSTKAGMTFNATAMHWIAESEDAFAWFTIRDEKFNTRLRVIVPPGIPQPSQ